MKVASQKKRKKFVIKEYKYKWKVNKHFVVKEARYLVFFCLNKNNYVVEKIYCIYTINEQVEIKYKIQYYLQMLKNQHINAIIFNPFHFMAYINIINILQHTKKIFLPI